MCPKLVTKQTNLDKPSVHRLNTEMISYSLHTLQLSHVHSLSLHPVGQNVACSPLYTPLACNSFSLHLPSKLLCCESPSSGFTIWGWPFFVGTGSAVLSIVLSSLSSDFGVFASSACGCCGVVLEVFGWSPFGSSGLDAWTVAGFGILLELSTFELVSGFSAGFDASGLADEEEFSSHSLALVGGAGGFRIKS